ncbi:MAG: MotA/TolQ/ExbB proton channel family protein [Candidatus Cloacimonetes bacterium]|nr:MotA/TolQ/ExbB proton channel family protein [Candidatus Cloacimonadota bacterium]
MKKYLGKSLLLIILLSGLLLCANLFAQEAITEELEVEQITQAVQPVLPNFEQVEPMSGFETLARRLVGSYMVQLFIDGGFVSWPLLLLLIWGLAWSIWKIVALSYGKANINEFLNKITPLIKEKKYSQAAEISKQTRGPVAAIAYAGLLKADKDTEVLEKAIENASTIEMAFLEKGLVGIAMTINLAPMVGFFGTIVGMISAFDAIAKAGDVDPTIVAEGIKIALVTTMMGLAIAIPIQFLNTIVYQMIDGLVLDMQRTADKIVETIVENK